ncbi:homeodomain-interacting protein kinase 1-like [Thalassophryne amazonica]|uniref:homeodomain-interacting protein kinase 1-like n=1 Tax=Thalassophryne amazonica TaxID=390379 RepID=UPI001470D48B|nr:homeodomain-interacting protein kinase 1-like [Thalassophryne amazonica]
MWTTGLLTAEMLLGHDLFPADCEYDLLRSVILTLNELPADLLNIGKYTKKYFTKHEGVWSIKSPETYRNESDSKCTDKFIRYFNSLNDLKHYYKHNIGSEHPDLEEFLDLLEKMLRVDYRERITPTEALKHNFITRKHLANTNHEKENSSVAQVLCTNDKEEAVVDQEMIANSISEYKREDETGYSSKSCTCIKSEDETSGTAQTSKCYDQFLNQSKLYTYLVKNMIGEGAYGKVFQCTDMRTGTPVAMKVQTIEDAEEEFSCMIKLQALDPDEHHLIRLLECFPFKGKLCMVYELLDQSLFDFVHDKNQTQP